jgi:hypothetical protein
MTDEVKHPQRAHAWFPSEWDFGETPQDGIGGPVPLDPLIIYVHDGDFDVEDGIPVFWFSLRDVVTSAAEGSDCDSGGMRRLRDGLTDLIKLFE